MGQARVEETQVSAMGAQYRTWLGSWDGGGTGKLGPFQGFQRQMPLGVGAPALKARSALKPAEPPTPGWGDVIGSQWDRTLPGVLAGGH